MRRNRLSVCCANVTMTKSRATRCMVAMGLMLGVSACTNPYNPVQRFVGGGLIGAGSGAAIGLLLPAVTVRPLAPQSAEL